jgi:DNA-binding XRE family transcriptional regulator
MIEFGKRVQMIRENVLKMNQSELAEKINITHLMPKFLIVFYG